MTNRAGRRDAKPAAGAGTKPPTPLHVLDRTKREELEKRLAAVPAVDNPGVEIETFETDQRDANKVIRRLERKITVLDTNLEYAYAWINRAVQYIATRDARMTILEEALGLPVSATPMEAPPVRAAENAPPATNSQPPVDTVDDATQAGEPLDHAAEAASAD